jgi:uncharacterized membrane protein YgcG
VAALVLIGVAAVVGGVAWALSDDGSIENDPMVVIAPEVNKRSVEVVAMTPRERVRQNRLKKARRELENYKKTGEVLPNGEIKTVDVDGSPLYIHPELIEGIGRYGEPLYATVKYKRRAAVPLRKEIKSMAPAKFMPKILDVRDQDILTFGTKPSEQDDDKGGGNGGGKGAGKGAGKGGGSKGG